MSVDLIRVADAMQMLNASYIRGQHDVLLSMIDAINAAQEHGNPREVSELLRQFVNGTLERLPPVPALPGQEVAK